MKLLPTGSTLWLVAHELRLTLRAWTSSARGARGLIVSAVVLGVLALSVGTPVAIWANKAGPLPIAPPFVLIVDATLLFVFTLLLSFTVSRATQIFYDRGDLDLLLSSPLPARRVLTARCLGMAVNAAAVFLILVSPVVLPSIVMGHPQWLAVYAVLGALSLVATSIGIVLAMGLFALIGPRATRTLAQVISILMGAIFYLASQLSRYTFRGDSNAYKQGFQDFMSSGAFAPDQPAAWPMRALTGEPIPTLVITLGSILLFLAVISILGGRFERDAAAAAGVGIRRKAAKGPVRGFTGGPFQAMLRKELRLMRRDVVLMSQVVMRVLYLIPTVAILWTGPFAGGTLRLPFLAAWVVFMTGQIAGSLAWITMSGEQGLELLATVPAAPRVLRRAKLAATLIPVLCLVLIPVGLLTWLSPQAGLAAALGCIANAVSAGLIGIWFERPAPRSEFRRRRGGSVIGVFADLFLSLTWAGAAWLGSGAWWPFAAAPLILGAVALLCLQRPQKDFAEALAAK